MAYLADAPAASLGDSVHAIFTQQAKIDRDQNFGVAAMISADPNFNRKADYYVNIFNIAPVEHIRHRPVDFPTIKIAGCPKGKEWILAVRVPNVVNYKIVSADTGNPSFMSIPGERFATDLVNPANYSCEMWREDYNQLAKEFHGGGDDLSRRGVFWEIRQPSKTPCEKCNGPQICPVHDVPTTEGLRRSKARMEAHYRHTVEQAELLAQNPKTAVEIGPEHHMAADYLHVNATWHRHTVLQEACPNCGEPINPGVAYHASSLGGRCVLNWQRACASGVVKREDVPIESRWWDDDELEKATRPGGKK